MEFVKLHALGNDFIVSWHGAEPGPGARGDLARRICDRHTGVGADGLVLVSPVAGGGDEFDFRIINADGSEAEISGNGLRCAMACLIYDGRIQNGRVVFRTPAGSRSCEVVERRATEFDIRTGMGSPQLASDEIPFDDGRPHEKIIDYSISVGGKTQEISCLSVGNPHCDLFFDSFPARPEWHQLGSQIESHPFFPKRTNVELIHVLNRAEIEVLFWERGVGETLSSGTGACAAAIASMIKGLTDRRVNVRTALGSLAVEWLPDGQILQTGPASVVFKGTFPAP
jgi:diaminopimelate epimerase